MVVLLVKEIDSIKIFGLRFLPQQHACSDMNYNVGFI